MRTSEWIQAGFAIFLAIAAWLCPLAVRRRRTIALLAGGAILAVALARLSEFILTPVQSSILRDWLPVPLMLIPYWQAGQFFVAPNQKIQAWLVESDRRLLGFVSQTRWASQSDWKFGRFARLTMEWAYALCYPFATLGLATLYAAGLRRDAGTFWFFVLAPTYFCYVITPFVPALPPRALYLAREESLPTESKILRKSRVFNLWILKHGSIGAISFPSAHVASALAVSLVLLHYLPLAGAIFLFVTFWIAVAAVVGGYHYAVDVVLGALLTLAFYMAWRVHLIPSILFTAPAMALVTGL